MKTPLFTGCAAAIITPFCSDGVDHPALRRLLDLQIAGGTDAIIVCGTTGEASTMTYGERIRTVETVVRHVDGKVPVIAGTGSNSTETCISLSKDAASAGADGLLLVTPYYNKASSQGLIRHYTAVADRVDLPIILYNVPGRTGVKCTAEVYRTLSVHPNIQGVKEAGGDFSLIQETLDLCPEDFYIWSGNDEDTVAMMALGAKGVISVAANIIPRKMREMTHACLEGDFLLAGKLQIALRKLCQMMFCEVNPLPVKTAMAMLGCCEERFRLPLCEMSPASREELAAVLHTYHLL